MVFRGLLKRCGGENIMRCRNLQADAKKILRNKYNSLLDDEKFRSDFTEVFVYFTLFISLLLVINSEE